MEDVCILFRTLALFYALLYVFLPFAFDGTNYCFVFNKKTSKVIQAKHRAPEETDNMNIFAYFITVV